MTTFTDFGAALGRLAIAAIFLWSGVGKLLTPEQTQQYIASMNVPLPLYAYWGAVVVEIGGGLALLLGFGARLAALALAVFSVTAAVYFHTQFSDKYQAINFMKDIAIAGGLLQVVAFGAGGWSLDGRDPRI